MCAIFVVVGNLLTEQPFQMTFIEGYDVIESRRQSHATDHA
jgi:hypothetical protein